MVMTFCLLLCLAITVPTGSFAAGVIALLLLTVYILAGMFGPMPRYDLRDKAEIPGNDTDPFLLPLSSLVDAFINHSGRLAVLKNGPAFYPAILGAFRSAQRSINLEAYVFQKCKSAHQYVEALAERARAGVQVNLVLDAFGSLGAPARIFTPLIEAGGKVVRYNRLTWYHL